MSPLRSDTSQSSAEAAELNSSREVNSWKKMEGVGPCRLLNLGMLQPNLRPKALMAAMVRPKRHAHGRPTQWRINWAGLSICSMSNVQEPVRVTWGTRLACLVAAANHRLPPFSIDFKQGTQRYKNRFVYLGVMRTKIQEHGSFQLRRTSVYLC